MSTSMPSTRRQCTKRIDSGIVFPSEARHLLKDTTKKTPRRWLCVLNVQQAKWVEEHMMNLMRTSDTAQIVHLTSAESFLSMKPTQFAQKLSFDGQRRLSYMRGNWLHSGAALILQMTLERGFTRQSRFSEHTQVGWENLFLTLEPQEWMLEAQQMHCIKAKGNHFPGVLIIRRITYNHNWSSFEPTSLYMFTRFCHIFGHNTLGTWL